MPTDSDLLILIAVALFAAIVNGALGHGFSSITVPVALLFFTNRVLNPALVLVEIFINSYILLTNWRGLTRVWKRVLPIIAGLAPGVMVGTYVLFFVDPAWIKLATFAVLLPLIILQAAGVRKPIQAERAVAVPFGAGVGVLYAITTVSGPPLALMFNNQGFIKSEFRAALGLIRVTEAVLTASAYYMVGLYSAPSVDILRTIAPCVLIGVPVGALLIHRVNPETFRRLCMSFDAWVLGFGLSRVAIELGFLSSPAAYLIMCVVIVVDTVLLYRFFRTGRRYAGHSPTHTLPP
ncbi:MAG TPA: sulfite exporter TauE/SafE family protein [Nitrospiria bacterium]|nr:sulfite exporter TauE/SafE family protein [Nitrospiria bacterium]